MGGGAFGDGGELAVSSHGEFVGKNKEKERERMEGGMTNELRREKGRRRGL